MNTKHVFNVFMMLLFVTMACERAEPPDQADALSHPLAGTWRFASLVMESTEGDVFHPYGENLYGQIMYYTKGHMSFLGMRPNRPKFVSGDIYGGTPEEIRYAFENFDAYCGTYTIDTEERTVTHRIEGCRFPNWEGTQQKRYYTFSGDTLTLRAALMAQAKEWIAKAVLIKQ